VRISRIRQHGASTGLACSQPYRAAAPVDVFKAQLCELAGTQSQRRKAQHHGPVAQSTRCSRIERLQYPLELLLGETSRQRRHPPVRNGGDRQLKLLVAVPLHAQEAQ
jgi:hypothetical protein